jgi:hypothetical protein
MGARGLWRSADKISCFSGRSSARGNQAAQVADHDAGADPHRGNSDWRLNGITRLAWHFGMDDAGYRTCSDHSSRQQLRRRTRCSMQKYVLPPTPAKGA